MIFQNFQQVMTPGVDINLSIRKLADGQLMVGVLPKMNGLKDDAQNLIPLFTLSGPAADLDAGFFAAITQPIQKVSGLLTNMKQFEEQSDRAAKERKEVKDQKIKEDRATSDARSQFDKMMMKVGELEKEGKYNDALMALNKGKEGADEKQLKNIEDRKKSVLGKLAGGFGLFDAPAPGVQPHPVAASPAQPQPAVAAPPIIPAPAPIPQPSGGAAGVAPAPFPPQPIVQQPVYGQPAAPQPAVLFPEQGMGVAPQPVQSAAPIPAPSPAMPLQAPAAYPGQGYVPAQPAMQPQTPPMPQQSAPTGSYVPPQPAAPTQAGHFHPDPTFLIGLEPAAQQPPYPGTYAQPIVPQPDATPF